MSPAQSKLLHFYFQQKSKYCFLWRITRFFAGVLSGHIVVLIMKREFNPSVCKLLLIFSYLIKRLFLWSGISVIKKFCFGSSSRLTMSQWKQILMLMSKKQHLCQSKTIHQSFGLVLVLEEDAQQEQMLC